MEGGEGEKAKDRESSDINKDSAPRAFPRSLRRWRLFADCTYKFSPSSNFLFFSSSSPSLFALTLLCLLCSALLFSLDSLSPSSWSVFNTPLSFSFSPSSSRPSHCLFLPLYPATMAERYIPEHRRTQFKARNQFRPDELRRRREEQQVEIRKQKREENLAKRRGIQTRDGGIGVGGGMGATESDDEASAIESEVCVTIPSVSIFPTMSPSGFTRCMPSPLPESISSYWISLGRSVDRSRPG